MSSYSKRIFSQFQTQLVKLNLRINNYENIFHGIFWSMGITAWCPDCEISCLLVYFLDYLLLHHHKHNHPVPPLHHHPLNLYYPPGKIFCSNPFLLQRISRGKFHASKSLASSFILVSKEATKTRNLLFHPWDTQGMMRNFLSFRLAFTSD